MKKKRKMIVNNNEIHHIHVGTRQNETWKMVEQNSIRGKGEEE
jgi:hypothetical protein